MTAAKPTPAKQQQSGGGFGAIFPYIIIPVLYVVAYLIWKFVFGAGSHFRGGSNENDPLPGDYLGTIYKGGFVVPILMTLLFMVIVFVLERFITLAKASGSGGVDSFVRNVRSLLDRGDINAAIQACDRQRGAVANVVRAGLAKYGEMKHTTGIDKDQKVLAIQKEVEEATTLELPMLEKNLNILATVASIATLFGLFGTVIGMVRSFAALSNAGAPDSSALATGISEALVNTLVGILTSALAIIFYNYFSNRIDQITYAMDEAGFSIVKEFQTSGK